jgi:hypothetical protein
LRITSKSIIIFYTEKKQSQVENHIFGLRDPPLHSNQSWQAQQQALFAITTEPEQSAPAAMAPELKQHKNDADLQHWL